MAQKWANWLHQPAVCGSPTLQRGGRKQQWPTSGRISYAAPAVWRFPNAFEQGTKSAMTHKWADRVRHHCRVGGPPTPWSARQNKQGPTSGRTGYVTCAVWVFPNAFEQGTKSAMIHKWADGLRHHCRVGGSPTAWSARENQQWSTSGRIVYVTLVVWGVAQKWAHWLVKPAMWGVPNASKRGTKSAGPTSGQIGYMTPPVWGFAKAERGTKSEVAHKLADRRPHSCQLWGPKGLRAGGRNQKWPTSGRIGYARTNSVVAHKWADSLHNSCCVSTCACNLVFGVPLYLHVGYWTLVGGRARGGGRGGEGVGRERGGGRKRLIALPPSKADSFCNILVAPSMITCCQNAGCYRNLSHCAARGGTGKNHFRRSSDTHGAPDPAHTLHTHTPPALKPCIGDVILVGQFGSNIHRHTKH